MSYLSQWREYCGLINNVCCGYRILEQWHICHDCLGLHFELYVLSTYGKNKFCTAIGDRQRKYKWNIECVKVIVSYMLKVKILEHIFYPR